MLEAICVWVIILQNKRKIHEIRRFYAWQVVCLLVVFAVLCSVWMYNGWTKRNHSISK